MSNKVFSMTSALVLSAGIAVADVPKVAVDIAPVHSLVSKVMNGLGSPSLIIPPEASPHEYQLRPSEAKALQEAKLVFWIGEDLTPWLEKGLSTLAKRASVTTLLEVGGVELLDFREGTLFEKHDHDDDGHKKHVKKDDHDDHAHGEHDPHAWLSPAIAKVWLNVIAAKLSEADPKNAGTYFKNANSSREELDALSEEVTKILDSVREEKFVVFHDAYQYFEKHFNISASGAISLSDASDPSPARLKEIQERITSESIHCILAEPQFNDGIVKAIVAGTHANTAVIDPLGVGLEVGPSFYNNLIRNLGARLSNCF
ncbi:MAG: zinc ABC transporter substrate-binding protein [Paracoccaceae bacterium]|nr:zinc ABC transporter substrate-binding protein [Paracoccaceae bacterium]